MLTLNPNGKHIKHSKELSKVVITVTTQASVPQPFAAIFLQALLSKINEESRKE
jgi:hypothetical protein